MFSFCDVLNHDCVLFGDTLYLCNGSDNAFCLVVFLADILETSKKQDFSEILDHDLFFNCVVANKETPTFISEGIIQRNQNLTIVGDIACDPGSKYNPIAIYDAVTTWSEPVARVSENPILEVMAIDNLPSLLPLESSVDFASQLLPTLIELDRLDEGVWLRARQTYLDNVKKV